MTEREMESWNAGFLNVLCGNMPEDPQLRTLRMLACVSQAHAAAARRVTSLQRILLTDDDSRRFGRLPPLRVQYISLFADLKALVEEVQRNRLVLAGLDPTLPQNILIVDASAVEKQTRAQWLADMPLLVDELTETRERVRTRGKEYKEWYCTSRLASFLPFVVSSFLPFSACSSPLLSSPLVISPDPMISSRSFLWSFLPFSALLIS